MTPLQPVDPRTRLVLGISFFVLFTAVSASLTLGGLVPKNFLADPLTMIKSGWVLLTQMGFGWDIGMTVWRVVGGFVIAAALALPLGVLMGPTSRSKPSSSPLSRSRATCRPAPSFRS